MQQKKILSEASASSVPLFRTPFSREYWKLAGREFRDTRMLVFAALMIALRVALKAVRIPVGPYLDINTAFVANALGAMCFGPAMAIAAAAVSDTLGCILFPTGTYFFPFIFVEIAGSLVFALLLYRTEIRVWRIILSRFCICFLVNIVIQTPIMAWYYQLVLGKYYTLVDLPRIVKNLALFPFESVVLIILLRYAVPPLRRMGFLKSRFSVGKLEAKNICLLVILTMISAAAVFGYSVYSYNTTSLSANYTAEERYARNEELNAVVISKHPEWDADTTVTIVESAIPRFGAPEVTYTVAVYEADPQAIAMRAENGGKSMAEVRGYSKSPAAKDEALKLRVRAVIVLHGKTGETISYSEKEP